MKTKSMKKVLTAVLVATMVMGSTLTVFATEPTTKSGSGGATTEESVPAAVKEVKEATVAPGTVVAVGGKYVQNTITNVVLAKSVQGAVVSVPKDTIKANLGLKAGQEPKISLYDLDAKKSTAAMASINAAVEALGGKFVTALDIDLSAVEKGKKVELKDGSVAMAIGLPKGADTTKTYVMVCVQPGGKTTILEDQDTNPKTITFAVQAGLGAYALVAK